jgi:hypothetical protein
MRKTTNRVTAHLNNTASICAVKAIKIYGAWFISSKIRERLAREFAGALNLTT